MTTTRRILDMHMDNTNVLDAAWPEDLVPSDVPFKNRTKTVLRRNGFFDDPSLFNSLTASDIARWWNAGQVTVDDIQATGNKAIRHHHETVDLRRLIDADLCVVASEPWAQHIWHRDPRFDEFVPKSNATVHDIAISGSANDRRYLWDKLDNLRDAVTAQAALSLTAAVSNYIEEVSGQHGQRLDVLLSVTGLNGLDPISGAKGARQLNISNARMYQIVHQLRQGLDRARPQNGLWLPQLTATEEPQWPNLYTETSIGLTSSLPWRALLTHQGRVH